MDFLLGYYDYISNGTRFDNGKIDSSLHDFLRQNKILPMLGLTTPKSDYSLSASGPANELLQLVMGNKILSEGTVIVKGSSIERLYHPKAQRQTNDVDIVVRDLACLLEISSNLPEYTPFKKNLVQASTEKMVRLHRKNFKGQSIEIHVGGYRLSKADSLSWLDVFNGSYKTFYAKELVRVPSDMMSLFIMLERMSNVSQPLIRDTADLLYLIEQFGFSEIMQSLSLLIKKYCDTASLVIKLSTLIGNVEGWYSKRNDLEDLVSHLTW